ncbi:ionotropic receptor 21a-like [Panulirus ornatus]|uniref:ionotropic receptor 21a-like n=1 Tax=Panulirus ornatus TaxID=150431 RepID=UPI003A89867A
MTRTEPPLPRWQSLAFPFHKWTWLAVFMGIIVSGPLLFLLARASDRCGGERRNLQDVSYSWYYTFGLHFCEAHASLPRSTSTQVFVQFLWLYTMILTIIYSANLKSFLLVKKQPAMMETFQDLYESGLEMGALGKLFRDGFAKSSDPYIKGLAKVYRYYDNIEKIFPVVEDGRSVYLGNCITMEYLIKNRFTKRGVSRFRRMKEKFGTFTVGHALQRHSPLKKKYDQVLGWLVQGGLVRKFVVDAFRLDSSLEKYGSDDDGSDSGQVTAADGVIPLSLDHMQGVLVIACFGWFCSAVSFVLEKYTFSD